MGRRKFKLGRSHKNYERKRQSSGKNPIGRPSKDKKGKEEVYNYIASILIMVSTESLLLMVMQVQQSVESSLLSIQKGAVLPVNWLMKTDSNGLILGKIRQIPSSSSTSDQPLSLSHCLTIYENLTWTLYIHGKKVYVGMCAALESVPVLLQPTTVNHLLATLDSLNVCIGSPEEHFVELCDSHHGRILSPDGS